MLVRKGLVRVAAADLEHAELVAHIEQLVKSQEVTFTQVIEVEKAAAHAKIIAEHKKKEIAKSELRDT